MTFQINNNLYEVKAEIFFFTVIYVTRQKFLSGPYCFNLKLYFVPEN